MDNKDCGLFQAIVMEMCSMYDTKPDVKKRCAELDLRPDQESMDKIVHKLRLVMFYLT